MQSCRNGAILSLDPHSAGPRIDKSMTTYVMLSRLTAEGKKTLRDNPMRLPELNHEVQPLGVSVLAQYALLGPYDFLTIVEAPSPETMARVSAELGGRGTAHYETFPALPLETFIATLQSPRSAATASLC